MNTTTVHRARVVWFWLGGVSGCHPLAKFEWPLANQGQLQAQGSQVVLPPPPSLPIVHRDEEHVCACIPGLGAGRPTQHSCAWPRFTVTRTLRRGGNCDQLCWSLTHHIHVTRGLAFFCASQLLTIRCIVFHIWRRMVHSRPRLGSQQQAEGWEDFLKKSSSRRLQKRNARYLCTRPCHRSPRPTLKTELACTI